MSNTKKFKVKTGNNDNDSIVKLDHKTHILKLPDTYIGSIEKTQESMWYLNEENRFIKTSKVADP